MNISLFNGFLLLGFVVTTVLDVLVLGSSGAAEENLKLLRKMCRYSKVNSVLKAQCSDLELFEIPFNLNVDIQVLDLSENRLTELKNDSLHRYKKLVSIYLGDNSIYKIDEAAFAEQPNLKMLDLTNNNFDTLPKILFQLPYLRSLFLGYNSLTDSMLKVKVTSPLRLLDLSNNELTVIPNIDVQPTLHNLYVSDNKITSISTEDLAPFCSLKEIDLTRNIIRFNADSCDCQRINAWVKLRQIKVKPDEFYNCTNSPAAFNKDCVNVEFSNRTYELFDECSAIIQVQHEVETEKASSFWIYFVSCISVFFFVLFVVLFCVHKQKKQLTANDDIEIHQQEPANN